ncbi:MAG TPA: hypothetical protein VFR97_03270 [Capillimicrobium sp.]|nr:hypothetical protein [Capillimicrobium sp.]
MAYTSAEGRQEILDELGEAIEAIATALAALGVAYEEVDEQTGDRLEEALFGPVQKAYGRAKRTYAGFAARMAMEVDEPAAATGGAHAGARASIDRATSEIERADALLSELQDSMLPVEVGDRELRAGLSEVRELLGPLPARSRELVRTLGR